MMHAGSLHITMNMLLQDTSVYQCRESGEDDQDRDKTQEVFLHLTDVISLWKLANHLKEKRA